jgi:TPR repeat protein
LAADQELASAQYSLGLCYELGDGVDEDLGEAVRLYVLAAEQGHDGAQHNLGSCYERGIGVERNLEEAARYYALAADQENPDAAAALQRLSPAED